MKIVLEKGQNLFITSDTHYSHSNICRATTKWVGSDNVTRDFKSLNHMNDTIVNNINGVVGEDDILIHLGDFSFGGFDKIREFRNRINCKNIHLVYGNHDHHIMNNKDNIQEIFSSTSDYLMLDLRIPKGNIVDKYNFVCFHYPIASWIDMNEGFIHLHGHVHLPKHQKIGDGKSIDVGVDGNDMMPYRIQEIINLMEKQPIRKLTLPKDHHEKSI
jgi:calcineurin-like phosphoesterase family protein